MDRFISKIDLAPLCVDEDACIQFLYSEGLLRIGMLCPECDAPLRLFSDGVIHTKNSAAEELV